jgi:hypothetical protein
MKEYKVLMFSLQKGQQPLEDEINKLSKDGWQFVESRTYGQHLYIIIFFDRYKKQ